MRLKHIVLMVVALSGVNGFSQVQVVYPFQAEFDLAYANHPTVPRGILEAVAHAQTRMTHLTGNEQTSCIGLPKAYGVMGLILDGQGYFVDNLIEIQQLTPYSVTQVKSDPTANIDAYATGLEQALTGNSSPGWSGVEEALASLSEIPADGNPVNDYARSAFTFQVLSFLQDEENQQQFGFPRHAIDLESIYGLENYRILSSDKVEISTGGIQNNDGHQFHSQGRSFDYAPALWVATPSCNYSSRNGTPISSVTIHTIQGTYAGAISWAQNCNAGVSYHYVVRSSDGQVTQMVYEADKAWHVGSENPYTIGIEHEGYVTDPAWTTIPLYTASAGIVKDVTQSGYGINPLRTYYGASSSGINVLGGCTKIKGHQHYPNQTHTDPGIYWDWEYYYQLINDSPAITNLTSVSGSFFDSGGPTGNYTDDERKLYLIQPTNAQTITISFVQFSLELNWDYMYVYDGSTTQDPVLGVFTGSSLPSDITSSGGSMLIEFRSDCATQDAGWEIAWTSILPPVAAFVAPDSNICDGGGIQMQNTSSNAQTYSWSAPGATPSSSIAPNPTFQYSTSGVYDVTLIASGAGGTDTLVQTIDVQVDSPPSASFSPSAVQVPLTNAVVTFSNFSVNSTSYLWDFGDGTTSTDMNPWHEFMATGVYPVQLVAFNGVCTNDTVVEFVEVIDDLGLDEVDDLGFVVFPNPVSDEIRIELDQSWREEVTVQLYDKGGRLVQSNTGIRTRAFVIELSPGVSSGSYLLELSDGFRQEVQQILVN